MGLFRRFVFSFFCSNSSKMSHRKFEAPRHGSLGFLPKKRCRHSKGKIKSFPREKPEDPCHLTAFMGHKAGMTHIARDVDKVGSKLNKKETVEAVTIVETPPIVIIGLVGYIETPRGLRALSTVFAQHLDESVKRRFYKNWYRAKKSCYTKYVSSSYGEGSSVQDDLNKMKKYCQKIRVIAHTQIKRSVLDRRRPMFPRS